MPSPPSSPPSSPPGSSQNRSILVPNTALLREMPTYQKSYSMPAAVHEAVGRIVLVAERGGANTGRSEIMAALVYNALQMDHDQLTAIWLDYRKATVGDVNSLPSSTAL